MIYQIDKGNIFNSEAEALVNPVNCVGVMGKGLALQFSNEYPRESLKYKRWCKNGNMTTYRPYWVKTDNSNHPFWIAHFATKYHWRDKSKLEDIEEGLNQLRADMLEFKILSVAIPPLGCGLGGLNWADVKPLIEKIFDDYPHVFVYNP